MLRLHFVLGAMACAGLALLAHAATGLGDSATKVKATAAASKIGADGNQTVRITLTIDKGWHIYANPVGHEDYEPNHTIVDFSAKGKVKATVKFPQGDVKIADDKKKYHVYADKVVLESQVQRTAGDDSPLQLAITVNACDSRRCLDKGVVKLTVDTTK